MYLGNTTAKITSQHGLFYKYLIDTFSFDFAKAYLQANEEAIFNIKNIIDTENISCDFEFQDNFVFTNLEDEVIKIKNEVEAVNSLGGNAELVTNVSAPISILSSIKFSNQACFNPLKYIMGLCSYIKTTSDHIYENSKVYDVKRSDNFYNVYTKNNVVSAKYVVIATHYPIINAPGFYFLKMYQETSYVIAIKPNSDLFSGMYINTKSPILSLRTAKYNNERLVLLGGSSHKTGNTQNVDVSYLNLEKVAKQLYPSCEVLYRWHTQDCISLDKLPYIGDFSSVMPNVYVATGFKKWGMTTSNVASNIICDKIFNKSNPYSELFLSTRLKPIKNGTEFVNMLKQVGSSLILDKFKIPKDELNSLQNGEGKIVELDNVKIGVYKDMNGKLFALKPICTHLGCELSWNSLDKTWDCPCHGSRFNYDGKSLYDPSIKDIRLLDLT
ncbi:MAG: FAD-dependent oxidoreductase [Clostridia bacterium]|jgi:glycine/D-amino acid oxidase-like deaminating enzyme/nitrite reductase/ring-hydroxylating ferredoxin subunit|nr:FAD-dependent oxidoreductase [Clostridia bacterium]